MSPGRSRRLTVGPLTRFRTEYANGVGPGSGIQRRSVARLAVRPARVAGVRELALHLVNFQVLSRGTPPPSPLDNGLKDTVDLRPGEAVEVIARFDGYRGRYLFHCHNAEHEDMGMMANFVTT